MPHRRSASTSAEGSGSDSGSASGADVAPANNPAPRAGAAAAPGDAVGGEAGPAPVPGVGRAEPGPAPPKLKKRQKLDVMQLFPYLFSLLLRAYVANGGDFILCVVDKGRLRTHTAASPGLAKLGALLDPDTLADESRSHAARQRLGELSAAARRASFQDVPLDLVAKAAEELLEEAIPRRRLNFPFDGTDAVAVRAAHSWWPEGLDYKSTWNMTYQELELLMSAIAGSGVVAGEFPWWHRLLSATLTRRDSEAFTDVAQVAFRAALARIFQGKGTGRGGQGREVMFGAACILAGCGSRAATFPLNCTPL